MIRPNINVLISIIFEHSCLNLLLFFFNFFYLPSSYLLNEFVLSVLSLIVLIGCVPTYLLLNFSLISLNTCLHITVSFLLAHIFVFHAAMSHHFYITVV